MTSDTSPTPFEVSASSSYSGLYSPYRAFDKQPHLNGYNDCWASLNGSFSKFGIGNEWIQIKLDTKRILTRYIFRERGNNTNQMMPKVWSIQGSDNGTNWVIIQEYEDIYQLGSGNYDFHIYDINNIKPYLYYRTNITQINMSANPVNISITLGEWELYSIYK
jgi:hypothetical protein